MSPVSDFFSRYNSGSGTSHVGAIPDELLPVFSFLFRKRPFGVIIFVIMESSRPILLVYRRGAAKSVKVSPKALSVVTDSNSVEFGKTERISQ